ncbi:hypothetical protein KSP39_PZI023852 [Platanthera zijinensis]|uniref:Uncharacterized protein n=1 Tax=Platanthera zijinensis TaxID=2320716 RepID=A0AAP0FU31_9ASPA
MSENIKFLCDDISSPVGDNLDAPSPIGEDRVSSLPPSSAYLDLPPTNTGDLRKLQNETRSDSLFFSEITVIIHLLLNFVINIVLRFHLTVIMWYVNVF